MKNVSTQLKYVAAIVLVALLPSGLFAQFSGIPFESPPGGLFGLSDASDFTPVTGYADVTHNKQEVWLAEYDILLKKYHYEFVYVARPGTDIVDAYYDKDNQHVLVLLNDGTVARVKYENGDWMPHSEDAIDLTNFETALQLDAAGIVEYVLGSQFIYIKPDSLSPYEYDTAGLSDFLDIYDITVDALGQVWLATSEGVFIQEDADSSWKLFFASNDIRTIDATADGRLWAGSYGQIQYSDGVNAFMPGPMGKPNNKVPVEMIADGADNVYAIVADNYYAEAGKQIYKSAGGVQAFARVDLVLNAQFDDLSYDGIYYDISVHDTMLTVSTPASLFTTTNDGLTWQHSEGPPSMSPVSVVGTADDKLLMSVNAGVYKGDAGNWQKKFPDNGFQKEVELFRAASGTLYAKSMIFDGNSSGAEQFLIYKSTDNGETWTVDTAGMAVADVGMYIFDVDANGTQHAAAAEYVAGFGNRFTVWKKDPGQLWVIDTVGLPVVYNSYSAMSFTEDGQGNILLNVSNNGVGITFKRPLNGSGWQIEAGLGSALVMQLTNKGTTVVAAASTVIAKKTGANWQDMTPPAGVNPQDIVHTAAAFDGNGVLWVYYETYSFTDNVSRGHGFYYTTDLVTWHKATKDVDTTLFQKLVTVGDSVFALPNGHGGAYVLDTASGGNTVAINEPELNEMLKVGPNPAKNYLQINLQLANTEVLQLDLIDLAGRSIARVVNGSYDAGNWQFIVDTHRFAAGQYFCRVTTSEKQLVRKLVLTD